MTESVPSIGEIAADRQAIPQLPRAVQISLYRTAALLEAELRAALLAYAPAEPERPTASDDVITLAEAAVRLRISKDTLYRKWRDLPFAYKDPLDHQIKFSRAGINHHIRRQMSSGGHGPAHGRSRRGGI